jgi:hypothetical protein
MKDELTVDNFKKDYAKLVISHPNQAIRIGVTERLISRYYIHVREECVNWVRKEHGLRLFA